MLPALSSAASGLSASMGAMQVSAHNVANVPVADFHRQRALAATGSDGGVTLSYGRSETAGDDLAADMVGLLQARNSFLANLSVFKRADEAFGKLLEIA